MLVSPVSRFTRLFRVPGLSSTMETVIGISDLSGLHGSIHRGRMMFRPRIHKRDLRPFAGSFELKRPANLLHALLHIPQSVGPRVVRPSVPGRYAAAVVLHRKFKTGATRCDPKQYFRSASMPHNVVQRFLE